MYTCKRGEGGEGGKKGGGNFRNKNDNDTAMTITLDNHEVLTAPTFALTAIKYSVQKKGGGGG